MRIKNCSLLPVALQIVNFLISSSYSLYRMTQYFGFSSYSLFQGSKFYIQLLFLSQMILCQLVILLKQGILFPGDTNFDICAGLKIQQLKQLNNSILQKKAKQTAVSFSLSLNLFRQLDSAK